MISREELNRIARARLRDAKILLDARRFDAAAYMCGYAVEIKLKARICRTLHWESFPDSRAEFQNLISFKTHDLDVLLDLSGVAERIQLNYSAQWEAFEDWEPEMRYNRVGAMMELQAGRMVAAARALLKTL